ncbi:hypothetical protein EN943_31840 [Mesorhizobium sp. M7A.F.Ca.US.006.01.1.1]|uniref:Uncharacterized protein n=1 Tax=Mesorhizobium ciceri biovar biserrulae (strain HAMBI 2942 / LMG 23838 / WSM1271) TaxID=765698 RepID=E8TPL6_MESCW|nr:hypothetical protein Mesci_6257 [Mesorhizobium ciceri biovar biserrulae WSM1271]RUZ72022.1 hypothetical protein EN943_31840 [Mesorhizobium sp. M7A.F.Ca.US.006.01.1.1]
MPNGTFRQVALQVHDGTSAPLFVVKATFELIRNEPYPDQQVGA